MSLSNSGPLMTIIVPAYNAEEYIRQCLDSIVNQTKINHKVIVVNDGSTDSTQSIVEEYVTKYPDIIKLINQENAGQGKARNVGISLVDTPLTAFMDSDDWYEISFVEKITNVLDKYDEVPEIIFTLPWIYNNSTKQVWDWYDRFDLERIFFPIGGPEDQLSVVTNISKNIDLYALESNTNRRVYSTAFLNKINLRFIEGKKWEDVPPHFYALHHAKNCIALKNTGFFYRINNDNQTTAGTGKTRLEIIDIYKEVLDTAIAEQWSSVEIAYILRMFWNFITWSIDVTNTEVIGDFLKGIHKLFNEIPYKYFKAYFNTCSPHRRKEMAKTWILKSPFYMLLKDYRNRDLANRVASKLRRK